MPKLIIQKLTGNVTQIPFSSISLHMRDFKLDNEAISILNGARRWDGSGTNAWREQIRESSRRKHSTEYKSGNDNSN